MLAGKRTFAKILHVVPDVDAGAACLARLRAILPEDSRISASANGDRVIVRALAQTGLALRRLIVPISA
ncbi:MAG: hypothetical protein MO852_06480 [Candidatus Devosia euplotis]|nr:hypothetical protein [Candidatus Devosia euplotis]